MKFKSAIVAMSFAFAQSPALAQAEAPAKTYMATPDGKGDPNAITCRPPQKLVSSRMMGPEVCKTNQVWAQYRADGMVPAADGIHDVPSERWRTTNPAACRTAPVGGGGTANMINTNFSAVCD